MTVKELKELLDEFDENLIVKIYLDCDSNNVVRCVWKRRKGWKDVYVFISNEE